MSSPPATCRGRPHHVFNTPSFPLLYNFPHSVKTHAFLSRRLRENVKSNVWIVSCISAAHGKNVDAGKRRRRHPMQISGFNGYTAAFAQSLSEEQKASLEEILSNHSPEEMTQEDMRELYNELSDAGIPQSAETLAMMRTAGFGPRTGAGGLLDYIDSGRGEKGEMWDLYQQFKDGAITENAFREQIQNDVSSGALLSLTG